MFWRSFHNIKHETRVSIVTCLIALCGIVAHMPALINGQQVSNPVFLIYAAPEDVLAEWSINMVCSPN